MNKPKPSLATRTFTVPAGGTMEYARNADFLTCLSASETFSISMDNDPKTDIESGLTYRPEGGLHRLEIINQSDVAELVVTLAFGKGNIQDNRAAFSGLLQTQAGRPDVFETPARTTCADGAATLVLAADINRAEAVLFNDGAGRVYLQGAAGAAGVGLPIEAGGTIILTTTAAIYARNDSGGAIDILAGGLEFAP